MQINVIKNGFGHIQIWQDRIIYHGSLYNIKKKVFYMIAIMEFYYMQCRSVEKCFLVFCGGYYYLLL